MESYMIITKVDGVDYLTKVMASSNSGAEHMALNLSYCGKHEYGVQACQAYDMDDMKFSQFIYSSLDAETVSFAELSQIIMKKNEKIRAKDEAEEKVARLEAQIKRLQDELAAAKAVLEN